MRIDSLSVINFRNLRRVDFEPAHGANIIYGDNAQGKTNLLEAVWLFTGSRSFRGSKDTDQILFEEEQASLSFSFNAQQRPQNARISFERKGKKVWLNEIKKDRVTAFSGVFCGVVFSPDHLSLVKQGPDYRRRLINISLCQAFPKYGKVLENYYKILQQRNSLLKDASNHSWLLDTLDVWDKSLLDYGAYLTAVRAGYIRQLGEQCRQIYSGISGDRELMEISYASSLDQDISGFSREDYRNAMEEKLQNNRSSDLRGGSTSVGPHRDDLDISVNGKSARNFGSQGQQRSCVLALKLAECHLLEKRSGEAPVVMLDDVMSELDKGRRSYLLNHLADKQVLITCCDTSAFDGMETGKIFNMCDGELRNI